MMELSGSFRLQGRRSFSKLRRSNRSLLLSESITAACARVAGYERLSKSTRLSTDRRGSGPRRGSDRGRTRGRVASFLNRVFSLGNASRHDGRQRPREAEERGTAMGVKRRSSWLPDPDRRWPLQGW